MKRNSNLFFNWLTSRTFQVANEGAGGATSSGDDTAAGGDDTLAAGDDTASAGDDTAPASLLGGEDTATAASAPEPFTAESFAEIVPEGLQLSDDQAAALVEAINGAESQSDLVKSMLEQYTAALTETAEAGNQAWLDQQTTWQDEVRNDPDIGGDKLDQTLAAANEVLKLHGDANIGELLKATGLGNNVAMVKLLAGIHATYIAEGQPVSGSSASTGKRPSWGERLNSGK